MAESVKAIVNVSPGHAEIQDIPAPKLPEGSESIIVRPNAWAVNPDDVYHLDLEGEESCTGTLVGSDYAGVVVEVGSAVTKDFKKGDRIAGWAQGQNMLRKSDGAYAELISVKGDAQMKIPDSLSDVDAATQGIATSTMAQALYTVLKLPLPGESIKEPFSVFIYGGSTAMGISAIQFVKLSGGTVITTASPSNFEYLKSLGADHVLNYKSPTLVDDVLQLHGGPMSYAFDTFPNESSAAVCAAVLARDSASKYVALLPGVEKFVQDLSPEVKASYILAYSSLGEPYMYETKYWDVIKEDYEFQKKFSVITEELFSRGKLQAPRVFLNRGGTGLEGLLHGLSEVRANRVSGGKLVYTAA